VHEAITRTWYDTEPRTNRSPRSAFRKSDKEETLGICILVPLARIGAGLIIGSHRMRDGLNTCASRSLSSSRLSSCRVVTNPTFCSQGRDSHQTSSTRHARRKKLVDLRVRVRIGA